MGCHSGFSVHDEHAVGGYPLDFAQALAQKGAWWIGNTGYGYGMDDSVANSELLMHLVTRRLAGEEVEGPREAVGEALRWAKQRYLGGVSSGGFGTYDEKALVEATLYGLPMYSVAVSDDRIQMIEKELTTTDEQTVSASGELTETMVLTPAFELETGSEYGDYYDIEGDVQASPGRPVQPRIGELIPAKAGRMPHGAVLISATSVLSESFDPLISRPVTDVVLSEPPFVAESWFPAQMWTVNRLYPKNGVRLVVVPAQFRGDERDGSLRRFTELWFQVYYTVETSSDYLPPVIWQVESRALEETADFWVHTEDASGIQRVVMAYTQDGSHWRSQDLAYDSADDRWKVHFPALGEQFLYFVQAVDGAGNVSVSSNKGFFFEPTRLEVYLPIIVRDA
jgi:hypothetical protein